ncbi:YveK family protein [Peribacillus frigoritolerans]|uniref:YveK family protein n=1 Tax=Peribacillus frigoritolerans TaxID=450367 RepID=UPI002E1CF396|nr:Wzz/FepE/Etk N-terminal domain-containing protein [Peribacillus frigoritolerans]MED3834989.1 Wzz/FepE/Etk N-terminal domain-containing protein [Peribacillus frigoritolerans]MED3844546.1 Wzz/FepE/Etk N-terminal domain-containing protein [Peribacillus frigoritolerans]
MEETISIKDIYHTLKKRWKLIVLLTLCAALISGSISYFLLTPVYQASSQILVNQKQSENPLDSIQIQSNIDMINTYSVIIKSPAILEKVIDYLDLTQSIDQISQKITINSQENSQVFSVTVQDSNPTKAVEIANAVSTTFQKEIKGIMNVDNVSVLAKAEVKENPTPIKPNPLLNIAIAVVVGLMAGIGLAFFLEFLDNTIKDEKDIGKLLGVPVLGSIPKISKVHNNKGYSKNGK